MTKGSSTRWLAKTNSTPKEWGNKHKVERKRLTSVTKGYDMLKVGRRREKEYEGVIAVKE